MTVTVHLVHLSAILIGTYAFLVLLVALELLRFGRYVAARQAMLPRNLITLITLPTLSAILFWAFFFLDHHRH